MNAPPAVMMVAAVGRNDSGPAAQAKPNAAPERGLHRHTDTLQRSELADERKSDKDTSMQLHGEPRRWQDAVADVPDRTAVHCTGGHLACHEDRGGKSE